MQTTKYGIIWSQNVHFVTNLTVTGTGGLYPRMRDFFLRQPTKVKVTAWPGLLFQVMYCT